jgi:hypothetical protein
MLLSLFVYTLIDGSIWAGVAFFRKKEKNGTTESGNNRAERWDAL